MWGFLAGYVFRRAPPEHWELTLFSATPLVLFWGKRASCCSVLSAGPLGETEGKVRRLVLKRFQCDPCGTGVTDSTQR